MLQHVEESANDMEFHVMDWSLTFVLSGTEINQIEI
jgi:hypothetical protein